MALVAADVREEMTPQQLLQYEAMQTPDPLRASPFERRVATQVAYLASQHHTSDYNRLKFGANGAPGLYVPLSIQLPSHARDMRMYQAMTAERQLWWAADHLSTLHLHHHHHAHPILEARKGSPDAPEDSVGDLVQLEQELTDAIASHIPQPPPTLLLRATANDRVASGTKTSESHPINMSTIIPYDLLPAISDFFFTKQQRQCTPPLPAPTFLHLPRQLRLDCLMPVFVLPLIPISVPLRPPPPPPPPPTQPPHPLHPPHGAGAPPPSRRSAFSHSHPHHPALVIPPAALQPDLTTDDPTPPPLAPGQVIVISLSLAPTQVPLPPSPVDTAHTRSADEPETKAEADVDGHTRAPAPEPPQPADEVTTTTTPTPQLLQLQLSSAPAEPSKEVLKAIEEAASSALPIPIPLHILPASPPPPLPLPPLLIPQQPARRPIAPLQPLTNGAIHCSRPTAYNGKHVNVNANASATVIPAKGRSSSVNPIFVNGTPTHPILNGVPSTPVPTSTEFATLPPPLPTHANGNGNGRKPIVVHGPLIGNLLLSSCPGKKVRLNGPVKGRGTIYRNLGLDMQRMKDAGVKCVVCCLDDSELQFLGAPWEEYAREASVVGLDVLRIPMPEGFAPLAPGMLNDQLDFLIRKYTLQGQNILVHCRGGVGRAGLVACCWMLKVGLCGWIQAPPVNGHGTTNGVNGVNWVTGPQPPVRTTAEVFLHRINGHVPMPAPMPAPAPLSSDHSALPDPPTDDKPQPPPRPDTPLQTVSGPSPPSPPPPPIQWDTVDLVERVVRVVRWRRSVKAIETYEQVRFLVEFVEFLRGGCVPTPEVEAVDTNVVVNGYVNRFLNGSKENGVMTDGDIHVVAGATTGERDQEVQGA